MVTPPRPAEKRLPRPAPPRKKQSLPRPVKLTKPAGRSGAKLTADSTDGPFSLRLLEEERVGKYFHLTLCTDCSQKYLFKVKGYNVFLYKNIIMQYKYLNNNLRTFVEFLDQSIYALFRPAPRIFILAPPRPAGKSSAPPIPATDLNLRNNLQ